MCCVTIVPWISVTFVNVCKYKNSKYSIIRACFQEHNYAHYLSPVTYKAYTHNKQLSIFQVYVSFGRVCILDEWANVKVKWLDVLLRRPWVQILYGNWLSGLRFFKVFFSLSNNRLVHPVLSWWPLLAFFPVHCSQMIQSLGTAQSDIWTSLHIRRVFYFSVTSREVLKFKALL